jgi:riboflavin synthase
MFTGIVEELGKVILMQAGKLVINASKVLHGMELGDSIAVNGVCLTITNINTNSFSADTMPETLSRTNLGILQSGDKVNLERPLTLEKRLGGHLIQGHVDDTGKLASISQGGEEVIVRFEAPPRVMYYIVEQGFIAIDGISLTVVDCDSGSFWVSIVEYTRKNSTIDDRQVGDLVNLEVDIIAKYVAHLTQSHRPGITVDFLKEHGF